MKTRNSKEPPSLVRLESLIRVNNPLAEPPWAERNRAITVTEVLKAVREKRFESRWGTRNHLRRIAYLVEHPDEKPIEIDVGVPCLNYYVDWIIIDGNHRVAAALVRGDEFISASIGGQLNYAEELGLVCSK